MFIKYILATYIILFLLSIIWLTVSVKKKTGVFPIIRNSHGAYGFVDRVVLITYILIISNMVVFISGNLPYQVFQLMPSPWGGVAEIQVIGLFVIGISLLFVFLSQLQMRDSWRIGIDRDSDIELVQNGFFKYLRHPIYLFAILIGFGIVLVIPSILSISLFILLYIILSVQARLEEEFMLKKFGDKYRYFYKTRKRFF